MEKLQRSIHILCSYFSFSADYISYPCRHPFQAFLRFSNFLEAKRIPRGWPDLICIPLLILLLAGALAFFIYQLSNLVVNMVEIKKACLKYLTMSDLD